MASNIIISDPVGLPVVSKIGCIIFFVSLSSRSIHMSLSWILFLVSFRRVTFGFTSKKNPIERSLYELNFLCDKNALFLTRVSKMFNMQYLDQCLSFSNGFAD